MKYRNKPFKPRTEGATPVEKWIKLVNKWNSCENTYNNIYSQQRMMFAKAEVNDLITQYPALYDDLIFYNSLNQDQVDVILYADYKFNFDLPTNMPRPVTIAGYKLLD